MIEWVQYCESEQNADRGGVLNPDNCADITYEWSLLADGAEPDAAHLSHVVRWVTAAHHRVVVLALVVSLVKTCSQSSDLRPTSSILGAPHDVSTQ